MHAVLLHAAHYPKATEIEQLGTYWLDGPCKHGRRADGLPDQTSCKGTGALVKLQAVDSIPKRLIMPCAGFGGQAC